MFDHLSLRARDFHKSFAFYRTALAPLGFVAQSLDEAGKSAGFGRPGAPALWLAEGSPASSAHIAFAAADRAAVDKFFAAALDAGGTDNGKPGIRADYASDYYAAFVVDPDGNNIEAVCHEATATCVYYIGTYDITDPALFQQYPPRVLALLPRYGGEVLASDVRGSLVEGTARTMNAIIRFPSKEAALGLYNDPDYQEAKRIRQRSTTNITMVVVDSFRA
jgi:uncharacterized protein (DUF1330 family)/catechol 2,3-dioxygenase-like lactoylglutathione lyase family enzyme